MMFDAPIPGQSLTMAPGSAPWEQPPQYTDLNEAAEDIFDKLIQNAPEVVFSLEAGASAEAIARTILFAGFTKGKFSPDLAMLLAPITVAMVAAVGHKMGARGMKLRNPNKKRKDNLMSLYKLAKSNTAMLQPREMVDIAVEEVAEPDLPSLGGFL